MKCPNCKTNDAITDPFYGCLSCDSCQQRQSGLVKPNKQIEFTSEGIKQQRRLYGQDTWGLHRKGELSKEWVDKYGAKKAMQRGFSKQEIKNAKNVWKGSETYYK
jgi:hypothetical protein